jgi:hypothetical protein
LPILEKQTVYPFSLGFLEKFNLERKEMLKREITAHGYIFSENKYLEELVLKIRKSSIAKDDFRRKFEVNALLFMKNYFTRI